jgi:thiosulfate/3-mercaptopyruvate sulfurtransferase
VSITYCGGGYYGAFAALVLHLMGFEDVAMYDGALEEWTSDPSNPVEPVR